MRKSIVRFIPALVLWLLSTPSAWSGEEQDAGRSIEVEADRWLLAGPAEVYLPAFEVGGAGRAAAWALKESFLDLAALRPEAGDSIPWPGGEPLRFDSVVGPGGGMLELWLKPGEAERPVENKAHAAYLAGYLECLRRSSVRITVEGVCPMALFCNGERRALRDRPTEKEGSPLEVELDLEAGKHDLLVKTVRPPDFQGAWSLKMKITAPGGEADLDPPSWSLDPRRTFARIDESGRLEDITGLSLSPDGNHLAVQRSIRVPEPLVWIEVLNVSNGECEQVLRLGRTTKSPLWSPDGKRLAFRSGGCLYTFNRLDRGLQEVLHDEAGLQSFFWAPDSLSLYFLTSGDKLPEGDYTRIEDPRDRLTDWDETVRLHVVTADGRGRRPLTSAGPFSVTPAAVSPDGASMALVRRIPIAERPFFESEFWLMDLSSGRMDLVQKVRFPFENGPAHLTWSPGGNRIAFTAPPGETQSIGRGKEHNAFDTCLYVLDLDARSMVRLSDRFGESVAGGPLWWRASDGMIYFIAQQRAFRRIARIDPLGEGGLEFLTQRPSVVTIMAPAAEGGLLAYAGSSLDHPVRVLSMDLEDGETALLLDPDAALMARMRLGDFERFNFRNDAGDPMDGWIFYPPDFDETRSYPLIVYFYGGVSPREERFSVLTYHWLPANGYVVYVMNPTGSVGHTRAFADAHCNDWGALAGRDIIEGVRRVLEKKSFIDASRIGCYGGSYGGFMTMSLLTESDLFKAAVSLYGISNLASYWGAGIWGYTYGDTAMAGSYPWDRRDLFVGRSPLFKADRITAALLLLHGTSDVNVPPVESEQMFTALKVLGKDVAYVRFAGEDHGISGKYENLLAHRSMILEWFDKHLKGRPEGWERRWKRSCLSENPR